MNIGFIKYKYIKYSARKLKTTFYVVFWLWFY